MNQKTRAMILTKKQLRRRIAFAEITKHKRIMWETELIKADKAYRDAAEGCKTRTPHSDMITHNEEHAI